MSERSPSCCAAWSARWGEGACACRHLQAKLHEWHRFRKESDREREKLRAVHGLHVILEKCFLLGLNPAQNEEYRAAMARVDAETPEVPAFRVMEPPLVISRLHRQGAWQRRCCLRL